MKNMKTTIFMLIFFNSIFLHAHKQNVHQYIVIEAYKLLKSFYGILQPMEQHIGTNEIGTMPWETGLVVTGAWREDTEDPIYNLSNLLPPGVSGTHFWKADDLVNTNIKLQWASGSVTVATAFTKIQAYKDGNWEVVGCTDWLFRYNNQRARLYDGLGQSVRRFFYSGLINLYMNGNVQI